tara:strand:- start:283 stop:663 length:381 start_codon:yes stop_codon:yes gene_type:complete
MSYKLSNNAYSKQIREGYESELDNVNTAIGDLFANGGATVGIFDNPPGALSHLIFKDSDHPPTQTGEGDPELIRLPLLISPQHVKNFLKVAHIKETGDKVFILGPKNQYRGIIDLETVSDGYPRSE